MPWRAGACDGPGPLVHRLRLLRGLPEALSSARSACASIALALEELQPGGLAFDGAGAPIQGEPRGEGAESVMEAPRAAREHLDATVDRLGPPRVAVLPPALSDQGQKRVGPPLRPREVRVDLAPRVQIRLGRAASACGAGLWGRCRP